MNYTKNCDQPTIIAEHFVKKAFSGTPDWKQLLKHDAINVVRLMEISISKVSGIPLCEEGVHRDLQDNSDVKYGTVSERERPGRVEGGPNYLSYSSNFKSVGSKVGIIRGIVNNPYSGSWHYFIIPRSAYYGKNDFAISFDKYTQMPIGNNSKYEVPHFEDLCMKKTFELEVDEIVMNLDGNHADATDDILCAKFLGENKWFSSQKNIHCDGGLYNKIFSILTKIKDEKKKPRLQAIKEIIDVFHRENIDAIKNSEISV